MVWYAELGVVQGRERDFLTDIFTYALLYSTLLRLTLVLPTQRVPCHLLDEDESPSSTIQLHARPFVWRSSPAAPVVALLVFGLVCHAAAPTT